MAIRDVLTTLNEMERSGVVGRWALGGAVAAARYVSPTATEDVDVFVSFAGPVQPLDPLRPIYSWAEAKGILPRGAHLIIGDWPVQFLPAEGPLLEESLNEASSETVDGEAARVFSAEHLAAIALQLGRAKDMMRVEQMVREGALDRIRFDAILARHDLTRRWTAFENRYLRD